MPCLNRSFRRGCKQGRKPCRTKGLCFNSQIVGIAAPARRPRAPIALLVLFVAILLALCLLATVHPITH
jgi:hypothetical protein